MNRGRDAEVERAAERAAGGAGAGARSIVAVRSAVALGARRPRSPGADGMKITERLAAAQTARNRRNRNHHRELPA